jgi:predicted nucleic acid-binding protein
MVVFDATMLMLLIRPDSGRPRDPATALPVDHVSERIAHFVEQSEESKTRVGLPTPALSEVLVRSGASTIKVIEKIKEFSVFEILPFDELAAIELAIMTRNAIDAGDKRSGSAQVWNKVKYDRQIMAIARVRQATALYTDDAGLRNLAAALDMPAFGIADLDLPPETFQGSLKLEPPPPPRAAPLIEDVESAGDAIADG